jgi:hypothetical protein
LMAWVSYFKTVGRGFLWYEDGTSVVRGYVQ